MARGRECCSAAYAVASAHHIDTGGFNLQGGRALMRFYQRTSAALCLAGLSFRADTYFKSGGDSIEFSAAVRNLRNVRQINLFALLTTLASLGVLIDEHQTCS